MDTKKLIMISLENTLICGWFRSESEKTIVLELPRELIPDLEGKFNLIPFAGNPPSVSFTKEKLCFRYFIYDKDILNAYKSSTVKWHF